MKSLNLANDMFKRGQSNEDILARTGFWFDEEGRIKYEIDDSKAELKIPFEDLKPNQPILASDLIKHDLFFQFYPELADTPINFYRGKETEVGGFNLKTGEVDLNLNSASMIDGDPIGAVSDLLHETQHAVQKFENFSQGGSRQQFLRDIAQPSDKEVEEAFNKYMRLAGEAEARNVAFRYAEPKYHAVAKAVGMKSTDKTKGTTFLQSLAQDPMSQKYNVTVPQLTDNKGNPIDMRGEVMEGIQEPLQVWGYDAVNNEPRLKLNKFTFVKPLDPIYYFANLRAEKPRGIVTPLVEDVFNACKSNIAYLEATMAGAVCYSNQWGEFKNKGLNLSEVNNKHHKEVHEAATIDVKENYSLKQANDKRIDLFKSL